MKVSDFIIAMVLVVAVIVGMYNLLGTLASEQHYDVDTNTSKYKDTYNKIDTLQNISHKTLDEIKNITSDKDKSFFTGTWDIFKATKVIAVGTTQTTGTAFSLASTLITNFFDDLGVGTEGGIIFAVVITTLTILIASALIFLLIKRKW